MPVKRFWQSNPGALSAADLSIASGQIYKRDKANAMALFRLDVVPYTSFASVGDVAAMKTQAFKGLIEQLGELTEVQRNALMAELDSEGSANEAIALIEIRFAAALA